MVHKRDNTGKKNFKAKIKIELSDFRSIGFLSRITVIKISITTSENDLGRKAKGVSVLENTVKLYFIRKFPS